MFVLLAALPSALCAQGGVMSLKECIETGIRNNLTLAESRIDMEKSRTALTQSRSRLLPVIAADFMPTDYFMKPANVTSGTLLGNDFPDEPTWQKIQSMQYAVAAGVKVSVPLYSQTILAASKVAQTLVNLSSLGYEKAVEDLTVQIGNVYYLAQASQLQQRLLDENISRMKELYAITEEMFKGGVVMETDLSRVKINMESLTAQRDRYATLYEQQLNLLRFLLDLPPETSVGVVEMAADVPAAYIGVRSEMLPELRLIAAKGELAERQAKAVRAGYVPSVMLGGQLGAVGYQEKLRHFFHTDGETHNWFGNTYLALTVHIPIFDGNDKRLRRRQYEYDRHRAMVEYEQKRKQMDKDYGDALLQLRHNIEVFNTQQKSYRQAVSVYEVTGEKYKEGVASMPELLQDEMRLRNAQSACVQAHCMCDMARLELLKLSGALDELTR